MVACLMQSPSTDKLVLPRTFTERALLTVVCCGFAALMKFIVGEMGNMHPVGFVRHLIRAVGMEAFITFGLFSVLGVIWGLFAPRWLERILERAFWKVLLVIGMLAAGSILLLVF